MQSAEVCTVHDACLGHQFHALPLTVFEVDSIGLGGVNFQFADWLLSVDKVGFESVTLLEDMAAAAAAAAVADKSAPS